MSKSSKQNHLRDLAISESGFVFDPVTGATFTVNATGLAILEALRAGHERSEVVAELNGAFEAQGQDVGADLDEFLLLLERHDILAGERS